MPKKGREITNPELAILSLLAEQSLHGYKIQQIIKDRGMREWTTISFSSIYHILNKLEKKGWVKSQYQSTDQQGPIRRLFTLTKAGRKAWQAAALIALSNPQPPTYQFQLGLTNLPFLDKQQVLTALNEYLTALKSKKRELIKKRESFVAGIANHVRAMFDLSIKLISTEQEWLDVFIRSIE